jgi:hypothetical protein
MTSMKICGKVYVETWKSDRDGHQRERKIRCTLPSGHAGRHGWELDKVALSQPVTAKANGLWTRHMSTKGSSTVSGSPRTCRSVSGAKRESVK